MRFKKTIVTGIATLGLIAPTMLGGMSSLSINPTAHASHVSLEQIEDGYNPSPVHHSHKKYGSFDMWGDPYYVAPKLTKAQKRARRAKRRARIRKIEMAQNRHVQAIFRHDARVRARKKARKRARLHEDGEAERAYGQYESNSEKLQKAQKHHWSNAWQKTLKKRMKQESKELHYTPAVQQKPRRVRHVNRYHVVKRRARKARRHIVRHNHRHARRHSRRRR